MLAFIDKRGFFNERPMNVLGRVLDYLESRGIQLSDADHLELYAIAEGYPSHAARKGYRMVELHPRDVDEDGQVVHIGLSYEGPTLAWEEDYDQAVQVAKRLARERLNRPVLILDSSNKLVSTVDERDEDQPGEHSVFVSQGPLEDAEAATHKGIAPMTCQLDKCIPNLRLAYGRFEFHLKRRSFMEQRTGCVLYVTAGPDETHIVYRMTL